MTRKVHVGWLAATFAGAGVLLAVVYRKRVHSRHQCVRAATRVNRMVGLPDDEAAAEAEAWCEEGDSEA